MRNHISHLELRDKVCVYAMRSIVSVEQNVYRDGDRPLEGPYMQPTYIPFDLMGQTEHVIIAHVADRPDGPKTKSRTAASHD